MLALGRASDAGAGSRLARCRDGAGAELRPRLSRFLELLSRERMTPQARRVALERLEQHVPPSLATLMRSEAADACVSFWDYLGYNAVEAMPVSAGLLASYYPRVLAFVVRRQGAQPGLVGAAVMPGVEEPRWQAEDRVQGLSLGRRHGYLLGSNGGIISLALMDAAAAWLGAGLPPLLANRQALLEGRSIGGVAESLAARPQCRPARYLVYDRIEAVTQVAEAGQQWRWSAPQGPVQVLASAGADASPVPVLLEEALTANLGWITVAKALRLLRRAVPGADYVVLDAEGREGQFVGRSELRPIAF